MAEVLDSLIQHRVRQLVFAHGASPALEGLPPYVIEALGHPARELVVERPVEQAVASGAEVTALPENEADVLASVGGVAATLRY